MFGAIAIGDWVDTFDGRDDGTDFESWKEKMEDYLHLTDLHFPLSGKKPEDMDDDEWERLDRKALWTVRSTLASYIASWSSYETTTVGLMAKLADMFALKPTAYNKVKLLGELFSLQMEEGASAEEHLLKFEAVTRKLSYVDPNFVDEMKAYTLLNSLPSSWGFFLTAMNCSAGKDKLDYFHVRSCILAEESRRKRARETADNSSASNLDSKGRVFRRNSNRRGRRNNRY